MLEQQVKERQEKVDQEKEFHESFGRRQLTDFNCNDVCSHDFGSRACVVCVH